MFIYAIRLNEFILEQYRSLIEQQLDTYNEQMATVH